MRIRLVGCEVMYRELCHAVARSPHQVDLRFLPKGLHDDGARAMRVHIQSEIDHAGKTVCDCVVLGYGLCGNGIIGLAAREVPLIVPRAHDCITLLMGSREAFQSYFADHPGAYYRSTGWMERGKDIVQLRQSGAQRRTGAGYDLQELIERYGEDNGRYLYEQLNGYKSSYTQLTWIETGIEPNESFAASAEAEAKERGWRYEKVRGSLRWFEALVEGDWNVEDFLTVPPGHKTVQRFDELLIGSEQDPC